MLIIISLRLGFTLVSLTPPSLWPLSWLTDFPNHFCFPDLAAGSTIIWSSMASLLRSSISPVTSTCKGMLLLCVCVLHIPCSIALSYTIVRYIGKFSWQDSYSTVHNIIFWNSLSQISPECSSPSRKDCWSGFMGGVSTKLKVPVKMFAGIVSEDWSKKHAPYFLSTKNLCNMNIQYIAKETPPSYGYS